MYDYSSLKTRLFGKPDFPVTGFMNYRIIKSLEYSGSGYPTSRFFQNTDYAELDYPSPQIIRNPDSSNLIIWQLDYPANGLSRIRIHQFLEIEVQYYLLFLINRRPEYLATGLSSNRIIRKPDYQAIRL